MLLYGTDTSRGSRQIKKIGSVKNRTHIQKCLVLEKERNLVSIIRDFTKC